MIWNGCGIMEENMEGKDKCSFQKDKNISPIHCVKKTHEVNDCDSSSFSSLCIVTDPEFLKRQKELKIVMDSEFLKRQKRDKN